MTRAWAFSLVACISVLPLFLGCGSSGKPASGGLSPAELAKMMEDAKAESAKAPAPETTAKDLVESLTGEASAAEAAKKSLAENQQVVTGVVVDRSAEGSMSSFLTLDGGTKEDKAFKLIFTFGSPQGDDIVAVKVGDKVRIVGTADGEMKDNTLEFKDCVFYPDTPNMPGSKGGPPPMPKT